jgi:hypothetical protein
MYVLAVCLLKIFESFFKNELYKHLYLYIAVEVALIQQTGHYPGN